MKFFQLEAASGIVLFLFTLVAMVFANSPLRDHYHAALHVPIASLSLHEWINEGLMAVFFLLVGLEIKSELTTGKLSSRKKAALPFMAALGGMIVPAVIYSLFNAGTSAAPGWAIPMATDIAFAVGVLTLLSKRIPSSLKVFMLALAIIDDLGAVLVIAVYYTQHLAWMYLLLATVILILLVIFRAKKFLIYGVSGVLLWICVHKSGVHSTIAGILLASVIPLSLEKRLITALHPWVAFGIMPVFALANAGVPLRGSSVLNPTGMGILLGLVLGKQIGITLFSWFATRFKLAALPEGATWRGIYGVACLGGIGFTMSIFLSNLAFNDPTVIDGAKIAILTASWISALWGGLVLLTGGTRYHVF